MADGLPSPGRRAKYGELDLSRVLDASSVQDFLDALQLAQLRPAFDARGISTVDQLLLLTPTNLDEMGLKVSGIRVRLLKGLSLLRKGHSSSSPGSSSNDSDGDLLMTSTTTEGTSSGTAMFNSNSTSSMYIDSTISKPDMEQVCFCVSILVYDLIIDAETNRRAPDVGHNPFSLFQPRDIFALPGKRSRHEYETNTAKEATMPSDSDIRLSINAIHRLTQFNPGVLVVAMIYIERLRRCVGAEMLASTWEPTLLIAIIVAQKVWEDTRYMNVDFTPLCPALNLRQRPCGWKRLGADGLSWFGARRMAPAQATPRAYTCLLRLNRVEMQFLQLLDYNVGVGAAVYTEWYFKLCGLCERNAVRLKPLAASEAAVLEISSDLLASRWRGETRAKSGPIPGASASAPPARSRAVVSNVG